jgi:carboxymethylenebutenolidase
VCQAQSNGYLAVPDSSTGNPVLVLHAWWGLNKTMKRFCDRLARAGFLAFAPDLFRGKVAQAIPGRKLEVQS